MEGFMLNNIINITNNRSKIKTYDYSEYENIPKIIKEYTRDSEQHLNIGILMLEIFNDRFITSRNIKDIKGILLNYFDIKLNKLEDIKIYIGEHKIINIWFSLFKIKVYVDCD
jgi:hypothetical protein